MSHTISISSEEGENWGKDIWDAYFPCSAVMYSSQEIVLGAGAVSDCLLTGCQTGEKKNIQQHIYYFKVTSSFASGGMVRTWTPPPAHLKCVFADAASFAQALHDGFVPQDVLLTQVLSPLAWLQHQAVHWVEVSQEVSHPLLCDKWADFFNGVMVEHEGW